MTVYAMLCLLMMGSSQTGLTFTSHADCQSYINKQPNSSRYWCNCKPTRGHR